MSYSPVSSVFLVKDADESVNLSTALQNDNELFIKVEANQVITFDFVLFISGGTLGDFKCALTAPAGASGRWILYGLAVGMTDLLDSNVRWEVQTAFDGSGVSATGIEADVGQYIVRGMMMNGATAGNLQLQWAQNALDAVSTTVSANSYLLASR